MLAVSPIWDTGISIHAPLTGSDRRLCVFQTLSVISIHAPLTGSDCHNGDQFSWYDISIHAPLTGSDLYRYTHAYCR